MKLFQNKKSTTGLGGLVQQLQHSVNAQGGAGFVGSDVSKSVVALESLSPQLQSHLDNAVSSLQNTIDHIASDKSIGLESFIDSQRQAGVVAGLMAGDIGTFLRAAKPLGTSTETDRFVGAVGDVGRIPAMEVYDEKENRQAAVYSVAYNMQAARQDELGEALYPTVVVTPDQVGYTVSIHLVQVYNEVRRQVSGAVDNFKRRNIVHAVRDASILQNELTKIVPIHRAESEGNFVPAALLAPRTATVGDEAVTTSALAFGKKFSLLGVSQSASLLATGQQDSTDAIDTAVRLENVYLQVTDGTDNEVIRFRTADLPLATFNYAVQGNYRQMVLNFANSSIKIDKDTKLASGAASTLLAGVASGEWTVRLGVNVSGSVNLETADTQLMSGDVVVVSVTGSDGTKYAPTDAAVAAVAALFNGAKLAGYDLEARRTNTNRRQRGQLLDVTVFNQTYAVPLLAPITIPRPLGQGDNTDASDLAALITATRIRTSNAAVTELLRVADVLQAYVNNKDAVGDTPEILGVARFLVDPFFEAKSVDVSEMTASVKSAERDADIQGALVSLIRNVVYRMYRDSGYKAAADALNGGSSAAPTVVIATDPVLARYLTVTGDTRTLGDHFNVKIVSTLDERLSGKIFITFGAPEGAADGVPNPLHFGNMAWKPEMTLVLPLHRNGANSKELTVQPSFQHITNLPVLAKVEVTGLPELATKKIAIDFNDISAP